ncbi:hypothetical protein [Ramlibacter sp.]|uniref:hypothetical protein n=1 Tax=Ramlibacter sp. TaxID=1917967 RepID=UPI003D0FEC95
MIQFGNLDRSLGPSRVVRKAQFVGEVTNLIVPDKNSAAPRPQAFLVEQSANWTLPTHFHQEHQFQVFVSGGGRFGVHAVPHLAVHYASPHAGYGPLVSGGDGLAYMTMRAVGDDTGAWYLPDKRDHLDKRVAKRQAHGAPSGAMDSATLASLADPQTEVLLEPDAEGLAAWLLRWPAGATGVFPAGAELGGGRFVVVHQGSLVMPEGQVNALGVAWAAPGDVMRGTAGPQGLEAVVVQFPAAALQSFREQHAQAST